MFDFAHMQTEKFVKEKFNKRQTPRKRTEISGKIVIAVRAKKNSQIPDKELLARLEQLERTKKLQSGFAKRAKRWLSANESFGPRTDLKILLSLLARSAIDWSDFERLAQQNIEDVNSHLTTRASFSERQTFLVAVGINKYESLNSNLGGAESDARLVSETFAKHGGRNVHIKTLIGEQATKAAII